MGVRGSTWYAPEPVESTPAFHSHRRADPERSERGDAGKPWQNQIPALIARPPTHRSLALTGTNPGVPGPMRPRGVPRVVGRGTESQGMHQDASNQQLGCRKASHICDHANRSLAQEKVSAGSAEASCVCGGKSAHLLAC